MQMLILALLLSVTGLSSCKTNQSTKKLDNSSDRQEEESPQDQQAPGDSSAAGKVFSNPNPHYSNQNLNAMPETTRMFPGENTQYWKAG